MKTTRINDPRRANRNFGNPSRREFLQWLGVGVLGLTVSGNKVFALDATGTKILRGIFPIAQTPFTAADKLDLDALVREVEFIARGRVHGLVWPQMASEWTVDTLKEHLETLVSLNATQGAQLRTELAELRSRLDKLQGESAGQSDTVGRWIAVAAAVGAIGAEAVVIIHP